MGDENYTRGILRAITRRIRANYTQRYIYRLAIRYRMKRDAGSGRGRELVIHVFVDTRGQKTCTSAESEIAEGLDQGWGIGGWGGCVEGVNNVTGAFFFLTRDLIPRLNFRRRRSRCERDSRVDKQN